jgi:hypothetical protein
MAAQFLVGICHCFWLLKFGPILGHHSDASTVVHQVWSPLATAMDEHTLLQATRVIYHRGSVLETQALGYTSEDDMAIIPTLSSAKYSNSRRSTISERRCPAHAFPKMSVAIFSLVPHYYLFFLVGTFTCFRLCDRISIHIKPKNTELRGIEAGRVQCNVHQERARRLHDMRTPERADLALRALLAV